MRTKADRIFALIDAHRKADTAYGKAQHAVDVLELAQQKAKPEYDAMFNSLDVRDPKLWIGNAYPMASHADVDRHLRGQFERVSGGLPPKILRRLNSMKSAARSELMAMLRDLQVQHRRRQDRVGLTAAWAVRRRAALAEGKASRALYRTRPETAAGLLALLAYFRQARLTYDEDCIEAVQRDVKTLIAA